MNFCQSLQSNTVVRTRLDDREFSYPIMARKTPANPGWLEQNMQDQDIVEPVISGPSKEREPPVEIASPYHIEAHEENISDTMERSPKQAAPHPLLKHSDSETDAFVALQSSTGAVAANITTDVHGSSSSGSPGGERRLGGGGHDVGESEDDTHDRERKWEHELARRAG